MTLNQGHIRKVKVAGEHQIFGGCGIGSKGTVLVYLTFMSAKICTTFMYMYYKVILWCPVFEVLRKNAIAWGGYSWFEIIILRRF